MHYIRKCRGEETSQNNEKDQRNRGLEEGNQIKIEITEVLFYFRM